MRKLVFVFMSVVVLIFLFITYSKLGLTKKVLDEKIIAGGTDKEKILSFWEFYRQATKSRIAGDWNSAIDSAIGKHLKLILIMKMPFTI